MGDTTKISWTGATWNCWTGCTRVSAGCQNCYMMDAQKRYGRDGNTVRRSSPATFNAPLKWQREAEAGKRIGHDRLVFVCSWSDFWHEAADEWRADAIDVMRRCPSLVFQIPTKRPERIAHCLPSDWGNGWPNVWLLASVEDQAAADERIPQLLSVPAAVRGLSVEPLLGAVDLDRAAIAYYKQSGLSVTENGRVMVPGGCTPFEMLRPWANGGISWVIVGGESGPRFRQCEARCIPGIASQCQAAGVPVFVKQDCGRKPGQQGRIQDDVWALKQMPRDWSAAERRALVDAAADVAGTMEAKHE